MKRTIALMSLLGLAACGPSTPKLPYPAFVATDSLSDVFLAELPGIRAKRFGFDPNLRTGSYRIDLPVAWSGSSGASPGLSIEIFVLAGRLTLGDDLVLDAGGYAYLPSGSLGFNLQSYDGARILYAVNSTHPDSVIRTPLILDSRLIDWEPTDVDGVSRKVLRSDPGSGALTWLTRLEPGAVLSWQRSLASRESYLVQGSVDYAECFGGAVVVDAYVPGGFVSRPADVAHGGPSTVVHETAIWYSREQSAIGTSTVDECR
ncbi:MAG: DUF4437 domain-containing protein [Woeseiaceae bacterium]|nr:DUF4437 domain-containing protein [Woeseiaceae bacterium]